MEAKMWKSNRCIALLGLAVAACNFPEVSVQQASSSSAVSSSSASSSGGQGAGGATSSTTTGSGGAGGSGGTGGDPCTPGDCSTGLDKDGDGHADAQCAAEVDGGRPGDDCDDCDRDVHPEQSAWFADPRPSGGYDYDCSGEEDLEHDARDCGGLLGCGTNNVFLSSEPVPCGQTAEFGDCLPGLTCTFERDEFRQQRCH
jgi:hypothetical protein